MIEQEKSQILFIHRVRGLEAGRTPPPNFSGGTPRVSCGLATASTTLFLSNSPVQNDQNKMDT